MGMVQCCRGCGRDTRSSLAYCLACRGFAEREARRREPAREEDAFAFEDAYDEESGPDDVCADGVDIEGLA